GTGKKLTSSKLFQSSSQFRLEYNGQGHHQSQPHLVQNPVDGGKAQDLCQEGSSKKNRQPLDELDCPRAPDEHDKAVEHKSYHGYVHGHANDIDEFEGGQDLQEIQFCFTSGRDSFGRAAFRSPGTAKTPSGDLLNQFRRRPEEFL